ncbi:MAG: DUF2007 domain-containing protein [Gammaproteobacteria bacterium]|jgi:hypothetical protein|nr:DUF2007 domain-containing protein [Gammaproteobacteria bacterium]
MKKVFDALSNIEAHLVLHQLQQAGLDARIQGEHLQGGMGDLPALGNVRIIVNDTDEVEARQVIADWNDAEVD